jgi:site-specific recombinase XerD
MQFSAALEGYWLARKRNFSANTVRDYSLTFQRFQEFLGDDPELSTITSADINRIMDGKN